MRSFEERKAEVLSRSQRAIKKRKNTVRAISGSLCTLVVCVCILVGYNYGMKEKAQPTKGNNASVDLMPPMSPSRPENDRYDTPTGNSPEAITQVTLRVVQADDEYKVISDTETVIRAYYTIQNVISNGERVYPAVMDDTGSASANVVLFEFKGLSQTTDIYTLSDGIIGAYDGSFYRAGEGLILKLFELVGIGG